MGKGKRNRDARKVLNEYRPDAFPPETLDRDEVAGQLGAPVDGWTPELIYRYAIQLSTGRNVDWAIMIDAYRLDANGKTVRRRVERIDICDSEIHTHTFRRSDDPQDKAGRRAILESISAGDEDRVNRAFDVQLALLSREWPARFGRWIDG